jgi:hypothetical protein
MSTPISAATGTAAAQTRARDERKVVSEFQELLEARSGYFSPVRLAELAGVAFERTFTGAGREDSLASALARGVSVRDKMAAAEGGSMSAEETARQLGMTKQSILNLYHGGKLVAWRSQKQGAVRFPVWQFAERQPLPGLAAVLARLNAAQVLDDWARVGFFLQTRTSLGNRRPLDLLRENNLEPVLSAAEAYVQ